MAKGLSRGFRWSVADVDTAEIRRQVEDKAAWAGRAVIRMDRWFPSSKLCGAFGTEHAGLTLSNRTRHCPACGAAGCGMRLRQAGRSLQKQAG